MKNTFYCLFLLFFLSCNKENVLLDQNLRMEKAEWNYMDNPSFSVDISDTNTTYSVFVNVRFEAEYNYSNLFFLFNVIMPDGTKKQERIECELFDKEGLPLGKGLGDLFFIRYRIPRISKLNQVGKYQFTLEQNMRIDHLKGIHDIGVRIEKNLIEN